MCATERNFVLCLKQMDNHNGFCSSFDLRYVEFKSKFMVSRRWLISPRHLGLVQALLPDLQHEHLLLCPTGRSLTMKVL